MLISNWEFLQKIRKWGLISAPQNARKTDLKVHFSLKSVEFSDSRQKVHIDRAHCVSGYRDANIPPVVAKFRDVERRDLEVTAPDL